VLYFAISELMQDFNLYFLLGVEHILTWEALDHILFVAVLCARYTLRDWKKVLILITAFTIGHSITLVLAATGMVSAPVNWIEFLIPLTIAATAADNLWERNPLQAPKSWLGLPIIYFLALFFGMIHGLAYANTLLDLEGTDGLISHLLAFNLGIELAQLLVVAIVLSLSFIFVDVLKRPMKDWLRLISIATLLFSLYLAFQRFPL
jgi:hypothetical protein